MTAKEDQVDELQNRPSIQEARRPSSAKVDGRPPPRLCQEKQAGRQVAGRTQNEMKPKEFHAWLTAFGT
jgi:hypothetical protein